MSDVTPIGSKDEFIEASFQAHQAPWELSTRQYQILESSHPHLAVQARAKAAKWRAAHADEARRAPARPPTLPPVAVPPAVDEDIPSWWKRHAGSLVPVALLDTMFSTLGDFAKSLKVTNDARDMEIAALKASVSALTAEHAALTARITALEARQYKGVWDASTLYAAGAMVTHSGSTWSAKSDSIARRPGSDPNAWQLACKAGRDGRDGKDANHA